MQQEALKGFIKNNFDFSSLKKAGFFPKDMKHNDYEAQAKIICWYFGFESIYEYGRNEIRCHISYAGERPVWVNKNGKIETIPFVEISFPNQLQI